MALPLGVYRGIACLCREGNGTPLQYSCLENPMDRGAWESSVHGVTKGRTRLSSFTFTFIHWRRQWQPTPVFLPGESQGRGSLVGCRLWGRTESDTTAAPFIYVCVINTFTIPLYRGKSGIQTLSNLLTGTQDLGGRGWVTPRSSSCRFSSLSHHYTMRKLDKSAQLFPRSLFRRGSYST